MTDNKKLVEEARAFRDRGWLRVDYPAVASYITRLTDALDAAEKAHTPKVTERHDLVMPIYDDTPTDDEREALALLIEYAPMPSGGTLLASIPQIESLTDAILAAGFRLTGGVQ